MVAQVPEQNMTKREASQDASERPGSQRHKGNAGAATPAPGKDVASMNSQSSELGMFTHEVAETRPEDVPVEPVRPASKPAPWHVPSSQQRPSTLPKRSMQTVTIQAELLDHILTLLLQSSRRLNDLEATSYYTHMIPSSSEMCMRIDKVYQGYLVTAQEDREHNMGPPTIHRGIALLEQVMKMEESLAKKDGLKAMWPVVKAALEELKLEGTELSEAQSIIGHCKISTMFDKANTKLTFTLPQIVECCGKTTTLGSVVSRLLRSMGCVRKLGVAPPGFLDRKLSEALNNHREKK
jgi:hypothetical protein